MKSYFTLMLVPHSPNRQTITIKIPRWTVHVVLFVLLSSAVVFVSSIVYSSHVTRRMVSYEEMKVRTSAQSQEVEKYYTQTKKLEAMLVEITDKENQIRRMLGLGPIQTKISLIDNNKYSIDQKLTALKENVKESKLRLNGLMNRVVEMRKRFAYTPSIWPTHGRIMSTYGYRITPWRGFHSGIDINTAYGSPIRSAADGKIIYAGWRSGYGRTVIVNHGCGFETLYGHISRINVLKDQKVKKGQVIAYVGTSGYTTGPHLHYEVAVNGTKVNPANYLGLDMLKADIRR